ncbi:hypothetical protein OIE66_26340 [Nonomuraea sp. NBC_01738]|uniref:hypothetical protein n=1 Tax=Nonomuraea sp. NBC_01738 TaxID=2976003 RepID=UPI002E0FF83E|nr:hypothetical protein OIE66_26340 [Nonomuraea sp. NBC_01738]
MVTVVIIGSVALVCLLAVILGRIGRGHLPHPHEGAAIGSATQLADETIVFHNGWVLSYQLADQSAAVKQRRRLTRQWRHQIRLATAAITLVDADFGRHVENATLLGYHMAHELIRASVDEDLEAVSTFLRLVGQLADELSEWLGARAHAAR